MEFQSSMSAMEMEVRTSTATHRLDGISEQHVSNGNGGQNINSSSQPGWNFRAACQQWKWRSEDQQQLTAWMELQSSLSAMEMEVRTSTATHSLDGISEQQVSNGNGGQNINSNSQPGWNFRAACQQWKWRSEHQQQLTPWMEFQSSMSAMEIEVRTSTATHSLDGISEQHVSNGNGAQNINSNSLPGWNFRAACQQWKWRSEHQQQLTAWMEFQSSMSAMEMEVRTSTATHKQDGISEQHVSNGKGGQNITATHNLDGISEQHVSNGNGSQNINSNSLAGWNFRAACQQWKWRSEHHSNSQPGWNFRAACQQWKWRSEHQQQLTSWMEFQSCMSAMEMEVRTSTATHSLDGISEQHVSNGNGGQNINSNSQAEWNFKAACQHGNGGQNINSNSQAGWNFRAACQQWKWRSEHQQQLT